MSKEATKTKARANNRVPVFTSVKQVSSPSSKSRKTFDEPGRLDNLHKKSAELEQLKQEAKRLEQDHMMLIASHKEKTPDGYYKRFLEEQEKTALFGRSLAEKDREIKGLSKSLEEAKSDMKVLYKEIKGLNELIFYYKQQVEMFEVYGLSSSFEKTKPIGGINKDLEYIQTLERNNQDLEDEVKNYSVEINRIKEEADEWESKYKESLVYILSLIHI